MECSHSECKDWEIKITKVAIVNEWLEEFGGAERVCMALKEVYDEPVDVFALWNESKEIQSFDSILRYLPVNLKRLKGILSLLVYRYSFKRRVYDEIITISHLFGHTVRFGKTKRCLQINYILTPARYFWEPELDGRLGIPSPLIKRLRVIDYHSVNREAIHVAISTEIQNRIRKHWNIESIVIHPPVDVEFFAKYRNITSNVGGYLLSAGRFVGYKNHDKAIIAAFSLGRKIILAGDGPERTNLELLARELGVECEFRISPSREELAQLFSGAAAFLHPAIEDFGIMPIEAMATGTPVVGLAAGGLLDTVNAFSGILVEDYSEIPEAIILAEKLDRSKVAEQALRFEKIRFIREIKQLLDTHRK